MQIKISARHGHLSEEHQIMVMEKVEKLLHFFERITFLDVTVDLAGMDKKVEILCDAEHKHDFIARSEDPDLMSAVIAAVDKVKQQIKHYKERIQDHRRDPSHGGANGIKP